MISPRTVGCLVVVVLAATCGRAQVDFYVSTAGNDANSGVKKQPFRTIEHARDQVRQQIREDGSTRKPITVWIAGGDYYLDRTFELTDEDSGAKGSPVSYRAEPGAEVRLIGGRRISPDNFKSVEDPKILKHLAAAARDHIRVADLKSLGVTDLGAVATNGKRCEVFFNDKPLTLARWPNDGFVTIGELTGGQPVSSHGLSGDKVGRFTCDSDRPNRWVGETDIWLHGYWFWDWAEQYQKVEAIDAETRTILLERPYHHYGYRKGQRYRAINILAELDVPGEWYLDRRTSLLYVWPPEPMEKARIVLTILESPCILLKDASYVVIRDLIVETTRGEGVRIHGGKGNLVAGCTIRDTGGTGVIVEGGSENGVTGCEVYQTGMAGITISGGDRPTLVPAGNFATNNHIHHFARLQRTYAGAIHLDGVGNRADHNLIHDAPHCAVSFTGNENVMELNEIHDVCQETDDVGVFYTGRNWTVRGNVIRHNFIHHVNGPMSGPRACSAQGVYLDDCASGTIVFGNIIYKTSRAMLLGGGRDNVVENNMMLDCGESIRFDNRGLGWAKDSVAPGGAMLLTLAQMPYRQPPWSEKYPRLLTVLEDDPGSPKGNVIRFNVVCRSKPMILANEVSQFGTVADNLTTDEDLSFKNASAMDFRLRDVSVVYRKLPKFQRIPFERIGLQLDEYRKSLPTRQEEPPVDHGKAHASVGERRGHFTGADVPSLVPLLGDYTNLGVRTPEGRTDVARLLVALREMGARDFMHLVWHEKGSPAAWSDFQIMAPEFQKANIGLWLYLTPPSEGAPDPFGGDYVRWAVECAKVAKQYPVVKGICIDDFNGNVKKFTPSYCKQMMSEAHTTAPHLSLLVVCYFGYQKSIAAHVEAGAIDGVIFPYFYPHKNLSDTTELQPQIESYRKWLDQRTAKRGLIEKMPLVVMVYATKHSQSRDKPTPDYVKKCLEIGLETTRRGLTDGVVTYCLPKNVPSFVKSVAVVYKGWGMQGE